MLKDECIVVNEQDEVIGHESKLDCHRFDKENVSNYAVNGLSLRNWSAI